VGRNGRCEGEGGTGKKGLMVRRKEGLDGERKGRGKSWVGRIEWD
jgi:hypothetical protein